MKIAFGYKMRTGKDTSVDYLIETYGGNKITFANHLYNSLYSTQKIFDIPLEKDRKYLQIVGDWARDKDSNIFINLTLKDTNKDGVNYFCNDLRFMNEFVNLKKKGWICIKLLRDTTLYSDIHQPTANHSSECELDTIKDSDWDYIIDNNGTKEDLFLKLKAVFEEK